MGDLDVKAMTSVINEVSHQRIVAAMVAASGGALRIDPDAFKRLVLDHAQVRLHVWRDEDGKIVIGAREQPRCDKCGQYEGEGNCD